MDGVLPHAPLLRPYQGLCTSQFSTLGRGLRIRPKGQHKTAQARKTPRAGSARSSHKSGGKPVRGLSVRAAAAPAKRETGQDLGELLPDLGQLECEVTMVSPGLGGVPLGQDSEHTGLTEVSQVVDVFGRPTGDVGVDAESPVEVEARLLDLGIEAGNEELDVRQPLSRCRGLAQVQARA